MMKNGLCIMVAILNSVRAAADLSVQAVLFVCLMYSADQ